ncbi:hypothetical protein C8Q79DRAFT_994069 [Trametes meyenii]|nr:hypothetical protein C8Q79DRAFT_994069 [Trametes meyenii]
MVRKAPYRPSWALLLLQTFLRFPSSAFSALCFLARLFFPLFLLPGTQSQFGAQWLLARRDLYTPSRQYRLLECQNNVGG